MQDDYIDMREEIPTVSSNKCKIISFLLRMFLQFTTILNGLIAWYLYDYFIASLIVVLSFIIMGVIRSKVSNNVVPLSQREYPYTDKDIANWFTAKELCLEIE
ncbi:MAG: hypothetical protein U9P72_06150 [Campylobacterota bacterium]|nr:hypothetical protein [Campylobacterota bacterium]